MNYKIICFVFFIFIISCTEKSPKFSSSKNFESYSNKGFALVYDDELYKKKFINKKLNDRSLLIFNNVLNKETPIRVTNLLNGKYLIAKVGDEANYPFFYNSVISKRIATDLEINLDEPYIEIKTLNKNNSFIIGKAKTFDEEKEVATKVPIEGIEIENISDIKTKKKQAKPISNSNFKYIIKIADFYFEDSAKMLKNRLLSEFGVNNVKIIKISKNNFRVFKGPYNTLDSIKDQFNDIIKLDFDNIDIIKL